MLGFFWGSKLKIKSKSKDTASSISLFCQSLTIKSFLNNPLNEKISWTPQKEIQRSKSINKFNIFGAKWPLRTYVIYPLRSQVTIPAYSRGDFCPTSPAAQTSSIETHTGWGSLPQLLDHPQTQRSHRNRPRNSRNS